MSEPPAARRSVEPAGRLLGVVAEVVERAASATPPPGDGTASLFALLLVDPRNRDHLVEVVTVIVCDALGDPFRETTANRWRPLLPSWLRPQVVGAAVQRLVAIGVLVPTGRYVRCTDGHARNRGKLQPVYVLNLAALRG